MTSQGRSVDFDSVLPSVARFMESVVSTFKQLLDEGRVYEASASLAYPWNNGPALRPTSCT